MPPIPEKPLRSRVLKTKSQTRLLREIQEEEGRALTERERTLSERERESLSGREPIGKSDRLEEMRGRLEEEKRERSWVKAGQKAKKKDYRKLKRTMRKRRSGAGVWSVLRRKGGQRRWWSQWLRCAEEKARGAMHDVSWDGEQRMQCAWRQRWKSCVEAARESRGMEMEVHRASSGGLIETDDAAIRRKGSSIGAADSSVQ